MKTKALFIFIVCFAAVSFSQIKSKSKLLNDKTPLKLNDIEFILIYKNIPNSSKSLRKQLDTKQCSLFITKFNDAKAVGPYKYITLYYLEVYFLKGGKRTFRVNSNHIKENNDYTFDLGDNMLLETLWKNAMLIK